jgi:hypothetical protein
MPDTAAKAGRPTTKVRRTRPARLTVVSLPSLDPARAEPLSAFFDTVYGIAARLVRDAAPLTSTAA